MRSALLCRRTLARAPTALCSAFALAPAASAASSLASLPTQSLAQLPRRAASTARATSLLSTPRVAVPGLYSSKLAISRPTVAVAAAAVSVSVAEFATAAAPRPLPPRAAAALALLTRAVSSTATAVVRLESAAAYSSTATATPTTANNNAARDAASAAVPALRAVSALLARAGALPPAAADSGRGHGHGSRS